ncbi:TonB-dependent receptor [Steroidobacter agaridevorans]|uniref:TonB-dependent receptor n=1 Tax=Steroidobacter agaridevorans TaxID=2695856 RepID=UPI0013209A7F|nr:TonB-dependent receptor [Steroidobacter agaridevorans]GFE90024.1 TonB-dependent receptor [Steroidobacter agaridevorans]
MKRHIVFYTASAVGLLGAHFAQAQSTQPAQSGELEEVVVTGIRGSLEAAAEIKRESVQVVDSIVAEDIGKFPDPTTAAALQRVPGVQVSIGNNNEIVGVLIRGLSDIQTTLDGRELFSANSRNFQFQDLPADALARVDVIKSTTADLIEGGIAGVTDLRLHKPFNFDEPTAVIGARANYSTNVEEVNPQLSVLLTDRWNTGIGELGALLNVSWSETDYSRPVTYAPIRRSTGFRFNQPGFMVQNVAGGVNHYGTYERPQANAAFQLQATDELQFYADAVFTGYRSENQSAFVETQFFNSPATGLQDLGDPSGDCFLARVGPDGLNPNAVQLRAGNFTVQTLCNVNNATFTNATAFSSAQSRDQETNNYLGAFGTRWEGDRLDLKGEVSFQDATFEEEVFIVDIGKRIPVTNVNSSFNEGGLYEAPGNPLGSADGMYFRNGLNQNFNKSNGDLLAIQLDGGYRLDSFITKLQAGVRYADRGAEYDQARVNRGAPGGDLGTLVSSTGLGEEFYASMPGIPRINGGQSMLLPNPDYLRSDAGRDRLRQIFGFGPGDPAYQPERHFEATEKTSAAYLQASYEFNVGDSIIDGVFGVRPTRTERTIAGARPSTTGVTPLSADTTDTEVLPNFNARWVISEDWQARFNYAKTMRRPNFDSLNPGIDYIVATNPNVINSGNAGNPELKPQISDSFDATLEYYFKSGFVAGGVYYRDIKDRVINAVTAEEIDGITYNISRPRNVSAAELQGVELSGQMFFDFLPGAWAGFGVFGNYTWADTEVTGDDPLKGFPLQGVSEHNFNAGLLYERSGLSARMVYTYRSKYYDEDITGGNGLRPIDADRVNDPSYNPIWLGYVRAAGRLDMSIGYDISESVRVDLGGTNILGSKYRSYMGESFFNRDYRYDDSIYTLGMRVRF